MDKRVVHDDVVAAEQMTDHGDVCGMSADERDGILGAVNARQRAFELAMHRALARHRPARRHRRAVAVDRRLRRGDYPRIAVKPNVVV